jgi:hypothetical protein
MGNILFTLWVVFAALLVRQVTLQSDTTEDPWLETSEATGNNFRTRI